MEPEPASVCAVLSLMEVKPSAQGDTLDLAHSQPGNRRVHQDRTSIAPAHNTGNLNRAGNSWSD